MKRLIVTVTDKNGNRFVKRWKETANRIKCITWTVNSEDIIIFLDSEIISVDLSVKEIEE